jgi:hypothetical protein
MLYILSGEIVVVESFETAYSSDGMKLWKSMSKLRSSYS